MVSGAISPTTDAPPADHKALVAAWFDGVAAEWARRPRPGGARPLDVLLNLAPGGLILDAGCGAGGVSLPLAERGFRVRGVDLSPAMIAEARRATNERGLTEERARFEVGDIERLPLANGACDAIVCALVLDFTPHPGIALAELRRVLRPGGRLLLIVLGADSAVKRGPGHERWRRFLPDPPPVIPLNDILPWEVEALLPALGWRILEQRPLVGPTFAGVQPPHTEDQITQLPGRVVQQAAATAWQFVAERPAPDTG